MNHFLVSSLESRVEEVGKLGLYPSVDPINPCPRRGTKIHATSNSVVADTDVTGLGGVVLPTLQIRFHLFGELKPVGGNNGRGR